MENKLQFLVQVLVITVSYYIKVLINKHIR